jgi:hypothetical protein
VAKINCDQKLGCGGGGGGGGLEKHQIINAEVCFGKGENQFTKGNSALILQIN